MTGARSEGKAWPSGEGEPAEWRRLVRSAALALALTPALAALFTALLVAVLSIPDKPIVRHILADAALFEHSRIHSFSGRKVDVGTECIGVSFGLGDERGASAFEAAMRAPVLFDCPSLLAYADGAENPGAGDYSHYWHGYAVVSRAVLALFPYHDLRMLTFNTMAALFAFLAFSLARAAGARFAFAALLPFYFINYSGFFTLWTKAAPWIVMLVAAIVIVRTKWSAGRRPYLLFYFAGAATAYLDLLAVPLLVFGFPAALYFLFALKSEPLEAKAQVLRLVAIGAFWTLGYAGILFAKIAIAAAVLGPGIVADALATAAFRLNGAHESVKHFIGAGTLENLEAFKGLWGGLAAITFFVLPLARKESRERLAVLAREAPAVALIAASPFVWYEIVSNHSQIHGLFTHANLALTFLPFSLALAGAATPVSSSRSARP